MAPQAKRKPGECGSKDIANGKKHKHSGANSLDGARWKQVDVAKDVEPQWLVGMPVRIWWPMDNVWYPGKVIRFLKDACTHEVKYEDGDKEVLQLALEAVQVLAPADAPLPGPSPEQLTRVAAVLLEVGEQKYQAALQVGAGGRNTGRVPSSVKLEVDTIRKKAEILLGHAELVQATLAAAPPGAPAAGLPAAAAEACPGLKALKPNELQQLHNTLMDFAASKTVTRGTVAWSSKGVGTGPTAGGGARHAQGAKGKAPGQDLAVGEAAEKVEQLPGNQQEAGGAAGDEDETCELTLDEHQQNQQQQPQQQGQGQSGVQKNGPLSHSEAAVLQQQLLDAFSLFARNKKSYEQFREHELALKLGAEALVGRSVRVHWPEDEAWFLGTVTEYLPGTGQHKVDYVDGDSELLHVAIEEIRLLVHAGEVLVPPTPAELTDLAVKMAQFAEKVQRDAKEQGRKLSAEEQEKVDKLRSKASLLLTAAAYYEEEAAAAPSSVQPQPPATSGKAPNLRASSSAQQQQQQSTSGANDPRVLTARLHTTDNVPRSPASVPPAAKGQAAAQAAASTGSPAVSAGQASVNTVASEGPTQSVAGEPSTSKPSSSHQKPPAHPNKRQRTILQRSRLAPRQAPAEQAPAAQAQAQAAQAQAQPEVVAPAEAAAEAELSEAGAEDSKPCSSLSIQSPAGDVVCGSKCESDDAECEAGRGAEPKEDPAAAGEAGAVQTALDGSSGGEDDDTEDYLSLAPGEPIWALVRGWPAWPCVISTPEEGERAGIPKLGKGGKVCVVFFGDYEGRRMQPSLLVPFKLGVMKGLHNPRSRSQKFKKSCFEMLQYLKEGELPIGMVPDNNDDIFARDDDEEGSDEEEQAVDEVGGARGRGKAARSGKPRAGVEGQATAEGLLLKISSTLTLLDPGRIDFLNPNFHNEKYIFPIGYRASRLARTPASTKKEVPHITEITLAEDGITPLFRITPEGGTPVEADTATKAFTMLWAGDPASKGKALQRNGLEMFGLLHPRVMNIIQSLPNAHRCERFCNWLHGDKPEAPPLSEAEQLQQLAIIAAMQKLPPGVTPQPGIRPLMWECDVCGEDTEYEGSYLLTCDACRLCVHMDCYGVDKAPDGTLWLCDLCQLKKHGLKEPPPCVLCPVSGGAMKQTTDGRWCHISCALWIPEMGFGNAEKMEPIEGLHFVSAARKKLLCTVCKQPYGACIQCAGGRNCFTAFHPMCARNSGLPMVSLMEEGEEALEGERLGTCVLAEGSPQDSDAENREVNIQRVASGAQAGPKGTRSELAQVPVRSKSRGRRVMKEGTLFGGARLMCFCGKHRQLSQQPGNKLKYKSLQELQAVAVPERGQGHSRQNSTTVAALPGAIPPFPSHQHPLATSLPPSSSDQLPTAPALTLLPAAAPTGYQHQQHHLHQHQQQLPDRLQSGLPLPPTVRHDYGAARCLPLSQHRTRGPREPESLAMAEAKRLYVRQTPYLVTGCIRQAGIPMPELRFRNAGPEFGVEAPSNSTAATTTATPTTSGHPAPPATTTTITQPVTHPQAGPSSSASLPGAPSAPMAAGGPAAGPRAGQGGVMGEVMSMADRYAAMLRSVSYRLTCGKSAIHGLGAFAKVFHKAGDMVIEYAGDLIRPTVADVRERTCYDQMVGAGTYIFRLNPDMCVDATRAGNMAHLLNHSCDPNCYSRTVTVKHPVTGLVNDHVVIFAKRDILPSAELTYDYRFSGEEKLPCNCGALTCRGFVNIEDDDSNDNVVLVHRSQVTWVGSRTAAA